MKESKEISSAPMSPIMEAELVSPSFSVSCPPSQFHSPSFSRSPLLFPETVEPEAVSKSKTPKTPRTPRTPLNLTPRFITPLATPLRNAIRFTKFDPQDAWLPITESRNGNKYYAAFHTLCSGIGFQALILPVALTYLGWAWAVISLSIIFMWQLYTLWILIQLHESTENGTRYSRYLQLAMAAFGDRLGKWLAIFPVQYLSAGTCTTLIILGGSTLKLFYQIVCGSGTCSGKPPTPAEWYLIFTCGAVLLSQLPNLNSIAGVSLVGAITAVGYCTMIWVVSVAAGRIPGVSYDLVTGDTEIGRITNVLNGLGIVAFAFRGHNLILEIQGTMPSSEKHPSKVPMWKGVKVAYALIAICLFPLAIAGYWAYGNRIPADQGVLSALYLYHMFNVSRSVLGLISLLITINALTSFQIYGMPLFDDMEAMYTSRKKKPCPWWLRVLFRTFFGFFNYFMAVALPSLAKTAGLVGGIALPLTMAYPCFMWLKIKKPEKFSAMWWLNLGLGSLGVMLSALVSATGLYLVISSGMKASFFHPQ